MFQYMGPSIAVALLAAIFEFVRHLRTAALTPGTFTWWLSDQLASLTVADQAGVLVGAEFTTSLTPGTCFWCILDDWHNNVDYTSRELCIDLVFRHM